MPRPGPRRPYVGVRLDPEILEELDRRAKKDRKTRSELIRAAVDYYLAST